MFFFFFDRNIYLRLSDLWKIKIKQEELEPKMENNNKDRRAFFSEWLEKLQQESWQLELIISGLALYGVYSSQEVLVDIWMMADRATSPFFFNFLGILFDVGWKIFFINLLVHVILRALWIGAIGLRYVSNEIDYEQLNYSDRFTNYLRRKVGDYDDFIERLEKICSVIFSYTFLLFLLFLSLIVFFFGVNLPITIMESFGYKMDPSNAGFVALVWTIPYLFLGLVVFIDFITLGSIKRIKDDTVSKYYLPIYRFYSTVTLTFLYRPLIYNFIDDKYTRRLFFFSIPYIFIIAFGNKMFLDNSIPHIPESYNLVGDGLMIDEIYYDDLFQEKLNYLAKDEIKAYKRRLPDVRLSAYHIQQEYASIFIKHKKGYKDLLENKYNITPIYKYGWRFSFFNKKDFTKAKDTLREQITEQYKNEFNRVSKEYKNLRDSIRRKKVDDNLKDQAIASRDALKKRRALVNVERDKAIDEFDKNKNQQILKAIQSMIDVSIDDVNYTDSLQCYFSRHPNNGEEGIRCNFNVGNLEKGNHVFQIEQVTSYDTKLDSLYTKQYMLPFIKQF